MRVDLPDAAAAVELERPGEGMHDPESEGLRRIEFMGLPMLAGDFHGTARWLGGIARRRGGPPVIVSHINIRNFHILMKDPLLERKARGRIEMLLDGIGLKAGGAMLGLGVLPDLNGTDLFPYVMDLAARSGTRVFLLGGKGGVAAKAAARIEERYGKGVIAGHRHGYLDSGEEEDAAARISESGAGILLVGMGFPLQEEFCIRNADRLEVPLVWNVGGLFDFISGSARRAPLAVRRARLEWLFRFACEPRRMWRRNLVEAPGVLLGIARFRLGSFANRRRSGGEDRA